MADDTAIIIAFMTPVITALATALVASFGFSALQRKVNFRHKRLEALKLYLELQEKSALEPLPAQSRIVNEELAAVLAEMSDDARKLRPVDTDKYESRGWLYRHILLPRPRTVTGWIATCIYYFYGLAGASYFLILPLMDSVDGEDSFAESNQDFAAMFFAIAVILLLMRWLALRSWRKSVEQERSVERILSEEAAS